MAKAGHLDMLVEDWDMVPKYWAEYCQEHRAHPVAAAAAAAAENSGISIPCTLYCYLALVYLFLICSFS